MKTRWPNRSLHITSHGSLCVASNGFEQSAGTSKDESRANLPKIAQRFNPRMDDGDNSQVPEARLRSCGSQRTFVGTIALVLPIVTLVLAGCQTLSVPEAKQQAEQRWSGVRSKVKLQLAEQHFARRQFGDALGAASEAIALDAADAGAYAIAAKCHLELGQAASAERSLEAAAQANVASAELEYLRGVVLELRDDLSAAIKSYRSAREQDAKQVDYLLAEAECLAATGQAKLALELLASHAHAYDERGAVALLAARIAELENDESGAITWYREAIGALPDSDVVAQGLGVLLAHHSECTEAVHLLRRLIEPPAAAAEHGAVRRALAGCYLRWDDPASAQAILIDYARTAGDDVAAQLLLAQASLAQNDLMVASEAIHRMEQHQPNHREVILTRALLDWRRGRLPEAAATIERVIDTNPSDVEATCLLGEVFVAMGHADEAITAFERALFVEPNNAWALARLANRSR
jgi:Tfp pilus assembly protein PilF